jgi:hypothetical protein
MKYHRNKRGNVLLYIIVTMTILTSLGTGVFYMTTTSSFSGLDVTAQNKARYLAEAGIRYAVSNLRTLQNTTTPPPEYKLINAAADKFILEVSGIGLGGNITIKSTGVSNPGTPYQASYQIELPPITPAQYAPLISAPFSSAGTGSGGITSLTTITGTSGTGKPGGTGVYVDTANQKIALGASVTSGTYGCVWYQGWAKSNGSDCIAGQCNFNRGIRAYFDFQYNTPWGADGFTFAIVSAHNDGTEAAPAYINNVTDCGGGSYGEYMGYAGPGFTGNGLQPPKIAVEFDPHIAGAADVCTSGSRRDNTFSSPQKHAAFSYWGTNSSTCSSPSSNTYDDNRHGSGDGTNNPKNPEGGDTNSDGTSPYVIRDFDNTGTVVASPAGRRWSFRLEIDRVDDPTSADYRKYKLRAWMKPYAAYTDSNSVALDDTSKKFNLNNDYPPDFQQTIALTQSWHDKFDRILFGWTQGTGGLNQMISIRNIKIDFKNKNDF